MSYLLETSHVLTCVPKSDGFDQVNSLGNIQAVVWTSGSQEFNFNSAIDFFPLHLLQKNTQVLVGCGAFGFPGLDVRRDHSFGRLHG